jgi:haloalkane dehalogenase
MEVLRTPEECFAELDGFDWPARYAEVSSGDGGSLRVGYVDAGPPDGPVALLLHGEPSWSYLYPTVIPELTAAGIRAVAPDLVGFGRSDKPTAVVDHSYARHVEWMRALAFDVLDLRGVTMVGQDWGGLVGLRLVAENPDRFARMVLANTGLPDGRVPMPDIWWQFRRAMQTAPVIDVGRFVASGCKRGLSPSARHGYDAPFPDETYKAGPRAMPALVPTSPDDPAAPAQKAAWSVLSTLDIPALVAFSDSDPITGGMAPILRKVLPGAAGLEHPVIANAGHFLQEDAGSELGAAIATFIRKTGAGGYPAG